jgi:hypothetical protein
MAQILLEKSGNFLKVTDSQTGLVTRFLAKDTYYSFEEKNKVLVITWDKNNGVVSHKYKVSDLLDLYGIPWSSFSTLDDFLAQSLGFNGGGTSPTPGYKIFKALLTYNGYGNTPILDILEDTLTPTFPSINIYDISGGSGTYYVFDSFTTGSFPLNKTFITIGNNHSAPNSNGIVSAGSSYNQGSKIDLLLTQAFSNSTSIEYFYQTPIEITVYD